MGEEQLPGRWGQSRLVRAGTVALALIASMVAVAATSRGANTSRDAQSATWRFAIPPAFSTSVSIDRQGRFSVSVPVTNPGCPKLLLRGRFVGTTVTYSGTIRCAKVLIGATGQGKADKPWPDSTKATGTLTFHNFHARGRNGTVSWTMRKRIS